MKLIRKLGKKEAAKLTAPWGRNFSRTTRTTTKLDLFAKPALLNRAIRLWMSTHCLLRAKIASVEGELYFVFDERFEGETWIQDDADLENVKFLTLDQSKIPTEVDREAFFEDLSWLVTERQLCPEFDCFNELLWRLWILDISEPSAQTSGHEYLIILTFFHSISEGKNLHMLTLQLLDLIEFCWTRDESEPIPPMRQFELLPPVEELYFEHFDRSTCNNERAEKLPTVKKANYVDSLEASQCPAKSYDWNERLSNEWIYKLESKTDLISKSGFIRLGQLVDESKSFSTKSRRLSFSEQQTSQLIRRCKEEKCTVTMCLTNLVSFALKKLSTQHEKPETDPQFNVMISTTVRRFEPTLPGVSVGPEFIDQLSMGYYISATGMSLDYLKGIEPGKLDDLGFFWSVCRTSTEQLQTILARREVLIPFTPKPKRSDESYASFLISSMGVIPAKLPDEYAYSARSSFNIKQVHLEASVSEKSCAVNGPFDFFAFTCDGRLFVSVHYNSCVMSHARIDKFIALFADLFSRALLTEAKQFLEF